jgi:hypothetical protein
MVPSLPAASSVLVHEPDERAVAESRKPGGRSRIATVGEGTPKPARIGWAAPECAGERITKHFDQVRRLLGVRGAKTETVQIEFRPTVLGKCDPVCVDLFEQGARGVDAVVRFHKEGQPTRKIRVL